MVSAVLQIDANNVITLTRGDSGVARIFINAGTKLEPLKYILQETDVLYFGVMECNSNFEHGLIKKLYYSKDLDDKNNLYVYFLPEDTLNVVPGKYFYEIKLKRKLGSSDFLVDTVVDKTEFWVVD